MDDSKLLLLQKFSDDQATMDAVKEELLKSMDNKKLDLLLDNENLGADIKAREKAKQLIDEGFKTLKRLNIKKAVEREIKNPGL